MNAASVTYVGPHDAVEVDCPDGRGVFVPQGGKLATTREHAASLCEQAENWRPSGKADKQPAEEPAENPGGDAK